MFETTQTAVGAIAGNIPTVGAAFAGVIGVALAITLGPRLFKTGLRLMKGK